MASLRCSFEVTAGLIPGQPMEEYTKRWHILSEEWYADAETRQQVWLERQGAAMAYTLSLQAPASLNWVRLDWVWY